MSRATRAQARSRPMSPELERKLYYDGIELFNAHEFFARVPSFVWKNLGIDQPEFRRSA